MSCFSIFQCELPDPDCRSSPTALPAALSCHRCKTLRLECVVPDPPRGGGKASTKRKRKDEAESPSAPTASTSSNGAPKQGSRRDGGPNPPPSLIHFFTPEGTSQISQVIVDNENGTINNLETEEKKQQLLVHPYPLALLSALTSRVHNFGRELGVGDTTYAMHRIITSFSGRLGEMQSKLKFILLFIPHLPTITTLREELESSRSTATRLLLSVSLLLTIPDDFDVDRRNIEASLRRIIQQDLLAVLMMEPRGIRSIQALEFVAIYTPLTALPGLGSNQPVSGSSCLAAAKSSAMALGLHRSLDRLKQVSAASMIAGLGGGIADPEIEQTSRSLAERAIIWASITVWDFHFRTFEFGHTSSISVDVLEPELESPMVVAFTNFPEDPDEVDTRSAGCAVMKHRMRVLQAAASGKPAINKAGDDYAQGPLRANELSRILDKNYSILEHHRQSRKREFAVSAHSDFYTRCLFNWCELEAIGAGMLLKEALSYVSQGASAFFERTHTLGCSEFMVKYGGRNRIDETDTALAIFMSLSAPMSESTAYGCPPRSTCAFVILAAMHIMESCASSIAGFKRPHPRLASMMTRLEGLAANLKKIEPSSSIEYGSIPQTTSSIVCSIITHINAWQRKLLETPVQQAHSSSNPLAWAGPDGGRQNMGDAFSSSSMGTRASVPASGQVLSSSAGPVGSNNNSPLFPEPFYPQSGHPEPPPSPAPSSSMAAHTSFSVNLARPEATISDAEIDSILSGGMMFWPADLDLLPEM